MSEETAMTKALCDIMHTSNKEDINAVKNDLKEKVDIKFCEQVNKTIHEAIKELKEKISVTNKLVISVGAVTIVFMVAISYFNNSLNSGHISIMKKAEASYEQARAREVR